MNVNPSQREFSRAGRSGFWLLLLTLAGVMSLMFISSFDWGMALHSNDGPLGAQMNKAYELPGAYLGIWNYLYWLGTYAGSFPPNMTGAILLLGPHAYINFGAPLSLFLLGLSAWLFFRTLGFGSLACALGALAMALNGNYFSHACWGLISRALCLSAVFLAMAALKSAERGRTWLKIVLAGFAVGLAVTEGGDNGAIFSLYVAAFAFYQILVEEGETSAKVVKGVSTVAVVAAFAGILALGSMGVFASLAVKNKGVVAEMQSKAERYDWATQWSICKAETLRVIIPGLFGYRLDSPDGGNYWGRVGQTPGWTELHNDPEWQRGHPGAISRHSGAGEYAGVLVVLIAIWGLFHSSRQVSGIYSPTERKMIWFWGVTALVSLLFSWGRFAPFYNLVYSLPYVSTIRNPMKFMHQFHAAVVILFAYGLQGLARRYLDSVKTKAGSAFDGVGQWLDRAHVYEKKWFYGGAAVLALSVLAWLVTSSMRPAIVAYITQVVPEAPPGSPLANEMARFCAGEVGLFALFLAMSLVAVALIQMGILRMRWAGLTLGLLMLVDFYRADMPWVRYDQISYKYATNPIIETLRDNGKAYEHRVSAPQFALGGGQEGYAQQVFLQVYHVQWLQYNFQYYNIQAMEVSQMPREIDYYLPYNRVMMANPVRLWELTNTRYILGHAAFAEGFNQQLDPQKRRFKLQQMFQLEQLSPNNFSASLTTNGPLGLIEFTGALPRTRLYSKWQINTNDEATLRQLASADFDPSQTVLVSEGLAAASPPAAGGDPGSAEILKYEPRRIEVRANAKVGSVLLFNDRYDPMWQVLVDGKPEQLLRCNYLMRGVLLTPGQHTVVFRYASKADMFYLTLGCVLFALLLCAWLVVAEARAARLPAAADKKPQV